MITAAARIDDTDFSSLTSNPKWSDSGFVRMLANVKANRGQPGVCVRVCTVDEFFAHNDASTLLAEYAAESGFSGLSTPVPHKETYAALQQQGIIDVIAAFEGERMVGFITVLVSFNPSYSVVTSAIESYFVLADHRKSGAGLLLLHAAEQQAKSKGAMAVLISAPAGSRLAKVMAARKDYRDVSRVFYGSLTDA